MSKEQQQSARIQRRKKGIPTRGYLAKVSIRAQLVPRDQDAILVEDPTKKKKVDKESPMSKAERIADLHALQQQIQALLDEEQA